MKPEFKAWAAIGGVLFVALALHEAVAGPALQSAGEMSWPALRLQLDQEPALARPVKPGDLEPPGSVAANHDEFGRWLLDPARCAGPAVASPSRPLTLSGVIGAVICRYPQVRLGDALTQQSQAALDRAQAQYQPSLGVGVGFDASRGEGSSGTLDLRAEWVLYDFGARNANSRQLQQALQAVLEDQRSEALSAAAQAANLFTAAQAAYGRFDAAASNLRTADDNTRAAVARLGAGAATLPDRLQAETAVAQARAEHGRALRAWLLARGELAMAIGWPPGQPFELVPSNTWSRSHPSPDLNALMEEAVARHPRVSAARARLAEGRTLAQTAEANRWGSVTLSARAGRVRASSDTEVGSTASAAIGWTIPLFDRGTLRFQREDARAQILARTVRLDEAERQVALQVWQEGQALLGAREAMSASRAVLDAAVLALRVVTERFRQGVGNFADVLSAQTAAANARLQWVETQTNFARAEVRLAAATGRFGPLALP